MNKWLVVTLTTAVLAIAVMVSICLLNNDSRGSNVRIDDGDEDELVEVDSLPSASVTLPVGETYTIDLSGVPSLYRSDIGIDLSNECCEADSNRIKAVKIGKTVANVSFISSQNEYLSQKIDVEIVGDTIPFGYNINCLGFNEYKLVITPQEYFDKGLMSVVYDEASCVVSEDGLTMDVVIKRPTDLVLKYDGEVAFTEHIGFDVSCLKYDFVVGGEVTSANTLYLIEDASHLRYNELIVDIDESSVRVLTDADFRLVSELGVDGLCVTGDKIGTFDVELYCLETKVLTFAVTVCAPVATDIVADASVSLKVGERYTVDYEVRPAGYDYGVTITANGGVLVDNVFYADVSGEYIITLAVGDITETIAISVVRDVVNFDMFDRDGKALSTEECLTRGEHYLTYSTDVEIGKLTLNGKELYITSDFIVINIDVVGNYILNVYNNDNTLIKTYNFCCNG